MISNSSKYAIKAILYLSAHSNENNKMMVKDIAEPINVPKPYIAKLLQLLSKNQVISSTRGPKGGFYLSEENKKNSLMKIIEVIDGRKKFDTCMLSLNNCDNNSHCPLHDIINPIKTKLVNRLNNIIVGELNTEVISGSTFLPK